MITLNRGDRIQLVGIRGRNSTPMQSCISMFDVLCAKIKAQIFFSPPKSLNDFREKEIASRKWKISVMFTRTVSIHCGLRGYLLFIPWNCRIMEYSKDTLANSS